MPDDSEAAILEILREGPASSTDVARRLGVSRQAAHARLAALVEAGRVVRQGAARATRYRLAEPARWERRFPLERLAEDEVFRRMKAEVEAIARLTGDAAEHARSLAALFGEYTEDYVFARTRTVVRLFEIGVRFVSRSEAKRLLHGLERFREVLLDFRGVEGVGQGFADEVFRVWARAHPEVSLVPVHMNEAVALMVTRARRRAAEEAGTDEAPAEDWRPPRA